MKPSLLFRPGLSLQGSRFFLHILDGAHIEESSLRVFVHLSVYDGGKAADRILTTARIFRVCR